MALPRLVQHRQRRDVRRNREVSDLKHENQRLQRDIDRLKEQASADPARPPRSAAPKVKKPSAPPVPKASGLPCWMPDCSGADVRQVDLGRIVLEVCPLCKARRPKPAPAVL